MLSRKPLHCLHPAVLSLQQILGQFKPWTRTRSHKHKLLAVCRSHLLVLPDQAAYSKYPLLSQPHGSALKALHKISASSSSIPRQSSMMFSSCAYNITSLLISPAFPKESLFEAWPWYSSQFCLHFCLLLRSNRLRIYLCKQHFLYVKCC